MNERSFFSQFLLSGNKKIMLRLGALFTEDFFVAKDIYERYRLGGLRAWLLGQSLRWG